MPKELLTLARASGAKPVSIRRYAETFRTMGAESARMQIEIERWFRQRWHRRAEFTGDVRKEAEALEGKRVDKLDTDG